MLVALAPTALNLLKIAATAHQSSNLNWLRPPLALETSFPRLLQTSDEKLSRQPSLTSNVQNAKDAQGLCPTVFRPESAKTVLHLDTPYAAYRMCLCVRVGMPGINYANLGRVI